MGLGPVNKIRVCKKCKKIKDTGAYVGRRSVCRLCWPKLTDAQRIDCYALEETKLKAVKDLIARDRVSSLVQRRL